MTVTGSLNDLNQALWRASFMYQTWVTSALIRCEFRCKTPATILRDRRPFRFRSIRFSTLHVVVLLSSLTVLENSELSLGNAGLSVSDAGGTSESLSFWATLGEFLIPSSGRDHRHHGHRET